MVRSGHSKTTDCQWTSELPLRGAKRSCKFVLRSRCRWQRHCICLHRGVPLTLFNTDSFICSSEFRTDLVGELELGRACCMQQLVVVTVALFCFVLWDMSRVRSPATWSSYLVAHNIWYGSGFGLSHQKSGSSLDSLMVHTIQMNRDSNWGPTRKLLPFSYS